MTITTPITANGPSRAAAGKVAARARIAVFGLLAIVYLGSAFAPALQDDVDSTHAEAAREMLVRGDFVTLHVNGVRYLEKAPLLYWLVAGAYRIAGVNEFATRLPTCLAMFLLAWLAMAWGGRAWGARAGRYAGLFTASTVGFYLFTRVMIPEALLSLLIGASFYFFATALETPKQSWRWYGGYAALALAVLTKGLVGAAFVGITAAAYLGITGEWRRWREFRLATGLLLFFAIAAPWHIMAGLRNPRFFWFYFINEHLLRFLGKRYPADYNKVPASLYWSLHLVWLFPWSMYLPLVVRNILQRRKPGGTRREAPALTFAERSRLLCWLWAGVVLTFFAFSTSQEYYTFPAYQPLVLLLASAVAGEESQGGSRWLNWTSAATAILSMAAGAVLVLGLWVSRRVPYAPDISAVLAKHDLSTDTLSMSHILDLTGDSFAALRLPALLAAIALLSGPAIAWGMRRKGRHQAATWVTTLTMAVFFMAAQVALKRFDPVLSSKVLAKSIESRATSADAIAIYGDQAFGSSLLFYLRRPIFLVNGRTTSMWFGSSYPDAPRIFWNDDDLLAHWRSSERIFLFVPEHHRERVEGLISQPRFVVAQSSGKIIYSNRL